MANTKHPVRIPKINLLPKDPFFDTFIGKFMMWAIHVGRYIIVFTEIIVIMSFATRFKLDRDLTDLTARITQKQAIVQSFGDIETRIRTLQKKLSLTQKLLDENRAVTYFDRLNALLPADVELTQLTVKVDEVQLAGRTQTSSGIASLLTNLQNDPTFKSVIVDKISSGDSKDPSISFSIRVLTGAKADTQVSQPVVPTTAPTTPTTPNI